MEENSSKKEVPAEGVARLRRNQGLPDLDPGADAAVSGIALLLSKKLDPLTSSRIKKIRNRYRNLRVKEESQDSD